MKLVGRLRSDLLHHQDRADGDDELDHGFGLSTRKLAAFSKQVVLNEPLFAVTTTCCRKPGLDADVGGLGIIGLVVITCICALFGCWHAFGHRFRTDNSALGQGEKEDRLVVDEQQQYQKHQELQLSSNFEVYRPGGAEGGGQPRPADPSRIRYTPACATNVQHYISTTGILSTFRLGPTPSSKNSINTSNLLLTEQDHSSPSIKNKGFLENRGGSRTILSSHDPRRRQK
ncbi:unnamed protein product [Amoebophrya sp. A25]|nr:unnamed protein product [Amoebophrya sp. A25]|eukprot:GSA25T00026239001.1